MHNDTLKLDWRVTGFTNPVRVAETWLLKAGMATDTATFDRVAEIVGDIPPVEGGFIVQTYTDLQRLCELGGFQLVMNRNAIEVHLNEPVDPVTALRDLAEKAVPVQLRSPDWDAVFDAWYSEVTK